MSYHSNSKNPTYLGHKVSNLQAELVLLLVVILMLHLQVAVIIIMKHWGEWAEDIYKNLQNIRHQL